MTMPIDIMKSALRSVGALASGETPDPQIANDVFYILNEMLDQWTSDHLSIFTQQEIFHQLTGSTYIYTIGSQDGPSVNVSGVANQVGCAGFTASIAGNVLTVTAIGPNLGCLSVGDQIFGTGINGNTFITSVGTGRCGSGAAALGTYYLSQNYPLGITSEAMTSAARRPLRINSAIVRVVNAISGTLDYPVAVLSYEEYQLIGIKSLPGPWPRAVYMQPTEPMSVLNYWPNPSQGEVHLYADQVFSNFQTQNDTVILPQGYQGAIHWNLAELLLPDFGKCSSGRVALIQRNASRGMTLIKRNNMQPQMPARADDALQQRTRADAGWILSGGYMS